MARCIRFWCVDMIILFLASGGRLMLGRVLRRLSRCGTRPRPASARPVLNVFQGPRGSSSGVRRTCCLVLRCRVRLFLDIPFSRCARL